MRSTWGPMLISAVAVVCGIALLIAAELGAGREERPPRADPAKLPPGGRLSGHRASERSPTSEEGGWGSRRRRPIRWRDSVAVGAPESGSLVRGVRLPAEGRTYFTWDPILRRRPDRDWRRWGTDDLVRIVLRVVRAYRRDHPAAPRVGVGDLGLPQGGYFGPEVGGGIGHATHQNGLNVDVYYPRVDRRERPPESVDQIDLSLAQDLVDRFVDAGAVRIYVGPNTPLTGPPSVVQPLVNHDNHLHVLIAG